MNGTQIFDGTAHLSGYGNKFIVPQGKQLLVYVTGLSPLDPTAKVDFDIILGEELNRVVSCDPCALPATPIATTTATTKLKACGTPIILTHTNPVALIDFPQNLSIQPVVTGVPAGVKVWAVEQDLTTIEHWMRTSACCNCQ